MGKPTFENKSHDDEKSFAKMRKYEPLKDLVDVIDLLSKKYNIHITSLGRGFKPGFTTTTSVATALGLKDPLISIVNKFFNRTDVSENEFIYKKVIWESSDPINDHNFVKYSPHFWIPDQPFGCAVDIRSKNFTESQIQSIVNIIKAQNKELYVLVHSIKGNYPHIHLQHDGVYKAGLNTMKDLVDEACGYTKIRKTYSALNPAKLVKRDPDYVDTFKKLDNAICDGFTAADIAETLDIANQKPNLKDKKDTRTILPSDIDNNGLMEVLRIGDINFSVCPVTQISYSQSMQYVRFSTLRTVGDPKIANDTVPNNVTLNIIFPNADAINNQMRSLIAQFMVTPITIVQNRFITRTLKPLIINHKGETEANPLLSPEDESIWMIMTDLNVRSIPNFPEAFEVYITLEMFEDRVFGNKLKFLVDYKDLQEKYRRKQEIFGHQYIIPSEKTMLKSAADFKPGIINVTSDPNNSELYKNFYQSVANTFELYYPEQDTKTGGKLTVLYNSYNYSRENIRKVKKTMEEEYNQSLLETQDIIKELQPGEIKWFAGKGLNVIKPDVIQLINKTGRTTIDLLELTISNFESVKSLHNFRYSVMDPIFRFRQLSKDASIYVNRIGDELGLTSWDKQQVLKIFNSALGRIGTLEKYSTGLASAFKTDANGNPLSNQLTNPTPAQDIGRTDGLIGGLEALIGEMLFTVEGGKNEALSKRAAKINTALKKITELCLGDINEEKPGSNLDQDGLPTFIARYSSVDLIDGKDSISTGVSFSISNKVIPQQVIGWKQPTFQHLGRSDWSINMNIICKNDEAIRNIMFILNKMGVLSKQIQFTSPAKFINLDTTLHIQEGDPIFGVLGINSFVLNTVEVSSIPGQPGEYQINLGLEQADLSIHTAEKIEESSAKQKNKESSQLILKDILPVLKAIVINKDRKDYGQILDFEKIKDAIDNPNLNEYWKAYGVDSYDYMDKYNFYKLMLGTKKVTDPDKDWDLLVMDLFPTDTNFSSNKYFSSNKSGHAFITSIIKLNNLIITETAGNLIWPKGSVKTSLGLVESLQFYFESIGHLANASKNHVATQTVDKNSALWRALGVSAGGTALVGTVGTLIGIGPVGWGILMGVTAIALGGGAIGYVFSEDTLLAIKDKLPEILPAAFNITVNNRIIELAKEFLLDDTSLDVFSSDFEIGNGVILQDRMRSIREDIATSLKGCYNDFESQIQLASKKTGISSSFLDPAFYLYSDDFITVDLIRELRIDIQNRLSMLATRANINALQLGTVVADKYFPKTGSNKYNVELDKLLIPLPKDSLITQQDLQWVVDVRNKIVQINKNAFDDANKENIQKLMGLQNNTKEFEEVFLNDYWPERVKGERTSVVMEAAFARLQLINSALRFETIKSSLDKATEQVSRGRSSFRKDMASQIQLREYNKLFKDVEYPKVVARNPTMTWYEAIIDAGGIGNPYIGATSVDKVFSEINGKSMYTYFTNDGMRELLYQIETIAKCKKAMNNNTSAELMAAYNALEADPRMLQKRIDQIQSLQDILFKATLNDNTGNPIRIFPTFKIYFIEEDAPEWGIFNDFYDYSAVQEITVVKDRKSASDTCVIKLSNVAGKLTDSFAENIPEIGTDNLPLTSMMLKPGMSILVKMGYSNSQVELPVVFYGIIIEVAPGPIVEIICQGYGAELNEIIAPGEGVHHGVFGDVKALGDVATWAIQQATGLNHFGKLGYTSFGIKDTLRLSGTATTGLQGQMKIGSFITGLPGLNINDPRDDNIFLSYNIGNIKKEKQITGSLNLALEWLISKWELSGNLHFDWYIRDQSIWDVLSELVYFSPDFLKIVLPYNDNLFPFIPKIRNTLYVGPRRGYYKYTDMFSMISVDNNIEFSNANKVADILFRMAEDITYNDEIPHTDIIDKLVADFKSLTDNDTLFKTAIFYYFGIAETGSTTVQAFNAQEIGKRDQIIKLSKAFRKEFTNYETILTDYKTIQKGSKLEHINRNFEENLKKLVVNNIGFNGIYYNIYGNNHQYKKVQQHHIATAYTNILNNNIIASADGWANQIKLVCPVDPTNANDINDVPIEDKGELVTTIFNLDDNILDDQIRSKQMFINNIDPSMWDDSIWAKKILQGEGTWCNIDGEQYTGLEQNGEPKVKERQSTKDEDVQYRLSRNAWELLPSRWRVGISILAEEARDMYNGELTIIGDSTIRPYDVIHLIDYVNDMHGSFEVGRVIHSLSPQTGFITRIKPDLIVNQKNKFNTDELYVASNLMSQSYSRSILIGVGTVAGMGLTSLSVFNLVNSAVKSSALLAGVSSTLGILGITAGVGLVAFAGYKAIKYHHERIIMIMNNIIGRDSLEILPLTYRNIPYVAGIEGYKKDSYLRHMISSSLDETGKYSVFERMGYMNAPLEFEFYRNVVGDSPVWSWIQTNILSNKEGVSGLDSFVAAKRAFFNLGETR